MRLLCQTRFRVLIVFVATAFVCATGCKSQQGFPKLGDLAWWRHDDAQFAEALPPASHFDPEPAIQMQTAGKKDARDEIKAIIAEAAKQNTDRERYALNGQPPVHPLRTPYSFDAARDTQSADNSPVFGAAGIVNKSPSSSDNSFEAEAGQIKTKLPDWDPAENAAKSMGLTKLQPSRTNSFDSTQNNFAVKKTTSDVTNGSSASHDGSWQSDFALPATSAPGLDANIEAARKSLNRAEENAGNQFAGFKQSLQNSVDRTADPFTKLADKATELTGQDAQAAQFKPNPPYAAFNSAQPPIQQADNSQAELARIQIAARQFQENADQLQKLADQARRQAEELTKQADMTSPSVTRNEDQIQNQSTSPHSEVFGSQTRVARATENPQLPDNSLRNGMPIARSASLPLSTPANASQDNDNGGYPSTSFSNYAPKSPAFEPKSANSDNDSSEAIQNGQSITLPDFAKAGGKQLNPIPVRADSGKAASKSDVIVPDAIMVGNSNFAPGSVNQLTPTGK